MRSLLAYCIRHGPEHVCLVLGQNKAKCNCHKAKKKGVLLSNYKCYDYSVPGVSQHGNITANQLH